MKRKRKRIQIKTIDQPPKKKTKKNDLRSYGFKGGVYKPKRNHNFCDIFNTDKKFNMLYVDPPWMYQKPRKEKKDYLIGQRRYYMRADEKYPTMSYEKLAGMKDVINRICEENCVMLMWATATKLPEAVDLIKAWGFEYVTVWMNWHKTNSNSSPLFTKGCGAYSRICAEVLLLSAKGEKLKYKYVPSMFIVGNTVQIDEESFLLLGKRGRIYPFKNENKFTPSSILEDKSHQMEDLLIEDKDVLQSFDCSEKIIKHDICRIR